MDKIPISEEILKESRFNLPSDSLTNGIRTKLFSPYKLGLFCHDIAIYLVAFIFGLFVCGPGLLKAKIGILSLTALMFASIFMLNFTAFNLYSYHHIYLWKAHLHRLYKALGWGVFTISLIILLFNWDHLYEDQVIIPLAMAIAGGVILLKKSGGSFLANLVSALGICLLSLGTVGMAVEDDISMFAEGIYFFPIFFTGFCALMMVGRYVLVHIVFNGWMQHKFRRELIIIGSDEEAKSITDFIINHNAPFFVAGILDSQADNCLLACVTKNCLGDLEDLPKVVQENHIDEIVITNEHIDKGLLVCILDYCIAQGLDVWFPPKLLAIINIKLHVDSFCGLPMIRLCTQKKSWLFNRIKHGLDALLTLPLSIMMVPLFLAIGLAIKFSSKGPVFYKPVAVGRNGLPFKMYKFRSMYVDQDSDIHKSFVTKLIKGEIGEKGIGGQTLKVKDDPRITPIGKILRKFSLDELPQMINVLKGEMSLVGPRPCLPYEWEEYEEWYKKRVAVRPGITGIWQVSGRSEVAFEDMILLDLYYIYNRSVMLDLHTIYETIFVVLKQKGAY